MRDEDYSSTYQKIIDKAFMAENITEMFNDLEGRKISIYRHIIREKKRISKTTTGRVVKSYPYFINMKVTSGNGNSYICSINKTDLLCRDCTYEILD